MEVVCLRLRTVDELTFGSEDAKPQPMSRLKSSMPFKRDLALQNIPLSKQPFKMQPQIQNEDVT